jgi:CTP synthase
MPSSVSSDTRFIFVTGGVVSSLGKGIAAASLGRLLVARGLKVAMLKSDPYVNVDPGTMSPFEHGEVYVTDDGAETDLDLGNYERFTGQPSSGMANVTTGAVYESVIRRERRGEYLGKTVQVVPHVTDEIKRRIQLIGMAADADVVIVEVGGTVGDIESLPFLEAIRQMRSDVGRRRCMFIHLTLVPFLGHAGEVKTKPTQHSVQELRRIGIQPDLLLCRSEQPLADDIKAKIALFASVDADQVISCYDVDTLYRVPFVLADAGVDNQVMEHLFAGRRDGDDQPLPERDPDLGGWRQLVQAHDRIASSPSAPVRIAVVGKYVTLEDAYMSVAEALRHAGLKHGAGVELVWVDAEDLECDEADADDSELAGEKAARMLAGVDGVLVPGGFGDRGSEGKINAVQWARTGRIPFLGICLGMQMAVCEFARNVAEMPGANSTEFDADTPFPVVDLLPEQRDVTDAGGTMRLGADPVRLHDGTRVREIYGEAVCYERHRHRYEVSLQHRRALEDAGLVVSGTSPDGRLVEMIELPEAAHPFFVAAQAHPEFKSRPEAPAPLFDAFVAATVAAQERRLGRLAVR